MYNNDLCILNTTVSNTRTKVASFQNRDIFNYHFYIFSVGQYSTVKATAIVNKGVISETQQLVSLSWVDSVGTQRWVEVQSCDNKNFYVQSSSNAANATLVCFGFIK